MIEYRGLYIYTKKQYKGDTLGITSEFTTVRSSHTKKWGGWSEDKDEAVFKAMQKIDRLVDEQNAINKFFTMPRTQI